MNTRLVVATLAHPRAQWPTAIAQWSTNGAVPLELRACLSLRELEAVVATGIEPHAVLLDGGTNRVDERSIAAVTRWGAVAVGVEAIDVPTDWQSLGVRFVLPAEFAPGDLMDLLDMLADDGPAARVESRLPDRDGSGFDGSDPLGLDPTAPAQDGSALYDTEANDLIDLGHRGGGPIISVCGSGGCGSSVISMSIAQGIAMGPAAEHSAEYGGVLLVDGARRTHQALYHHTGDVLPALGDLVGRVHSGNTRLEDLERGTFRTSRGYRLLAGVPTPRDFAGFDVRRMQATFELAARCNDLVVVDHDGDLPGGPVARALTDLASLWVVVTRSGLKGIHDAVRFTEEACAAGIPPEQVVVVCNQVHRSDLSRLTFPAEFARMMGDLGLDVSPTIVVPRVRTLEATHRDATQLPRALTRVLTNRIRRLLERGVPPRPLAPASSTTGMASSGTR